MPDASESPSAANSRGAKYQQKRSRVREAIATHPEATNTYLAKLVGTSRDTVIAVKREMKTGTGTSAAPAEAKKPANGAAVPAVISDGTDQATALIDARYQTMCRAIAECAAVDEVKDLRDKAVALEVYARQAQNFEAEQTAREIRVRAEKQAGKLLKAQPKAKPSGSNQHQDVPRDSTHPRRLADIGISRDQASQWQKLAAVPDETFEAVIADRSEPISAARVLEAHRANQEAEGVIKPAEPAKPATKPKRMHPDALFLWGLHSVTEHIEKIDIDAMLEEMTLHEGYAFMRTDTIANAKKLGAILCAIGEKGDE
jgi:hypothetical protein